MGPEEVQAIVDAYARGDASEVIRKKYGITRTELAQIVEESGVRRGMNSDGS